jgi:hypothetical protein
MDNDLDRLTAEEMACRENQQHGTNIAANTAFEIRGNSTSFGLLRLSIAGKIFWSDLLESVGIR